MKIAFIGTIEAGDPAKIGGHESIVRRLAIDLTEAGHNVRVIIYGADSEHKISTFFGHALTIEYHRSFSKVAQNLGRHPCDWIIETHVRKRDYFDYLAFKNSLLTKSRFAVIFMNHPNMALKGWFRNKFKTRFCAAVFGISPKIVNQLNRDGIPAIWLPPPVSEVYFRVSRKRPSTTAISFVGRIDPNKGLTNVISAFEQLIHDRKFSMRILGYYDPKNRHSKQLHARLLKLRQVDYRAQPHNSYCYNPRLEQELVEYLASTDVLILPYDNLNGTIELPLLVLEGLAAGCVVLTSNLGDIDRVIDEANLIDGCSTTLVNRLIQLAAPETIAAERKRINLSGLRSTFATASVSTTLLQYLQTNQ